MNSNPPALYVVPTPIGHLGDIGLRALEILRQVPWIAAEDTRHSAPLLKHYGCGARLLAAHQHNEEAAAEQIITRLAAGESVALISDAGTPAISDPGARLVARVRSAGYRIIPIPGACAAISALSASGLGEQQFLFYGFLPSKAKQREAVLLDLLALPYVLIFYEAPHRIVETVAALAQVYVRATARTLVLAREISKVFETIHSCPLDQAEAWLLADENRQRGEFVLLLSGALGVDLAADAEAKRVLRLLLDDGLAVSQAVKLAHAISGTAKNQLYSQALLLRAQEN
ncbi:MAG: 16S rRNA (cytidine(1402)-2'-O)-methyltransferase [Pseudomonadota bacterium]